jgi:hypothetical protein
LAGAFFNAAGLAATFFAGATFATGLGANFLPAFATFFVATSGVAAGAGVAFLEKFFFVAMMR